VDATARNIYLQDVNDLRVGVIEATHGGHVRLTAGNSIIGDCDMPNVIAGSVEFYAGRDIGYPLYLNVGRIDEAWAGGNISMVEISGNMNILGHVRAGGNISLVVPTGGIMDIDGDGYVPPRRVTRDNADIYAGGDIFLDAHFVGTLYEPLELISGGGLYLDSHLPDARDTQSGYPWVIINGRVGRGPQDIHVGENGASVPGVVIYNGQVVSGPWWTVRQFQKAQSSVALRFQANLLDSGIVKLPWFLQPDVSLLSRDAVRDDLRAPEQKRVSGAEEAVPEDAPRVDVIGLPVTQVF
jgi:hypothetical protein